MPAKLMREVSHIIDSEKARGLSDKEAEHRAWGHVMSNPMNRAMMMKDRKKKKHMMGLSKQQVMS